MILYFLPAIICLIFLPKVFSLYMEEPPRSKYRRNSDYKTPAYQKGKVVMLHVALAFVCAIIPVFNIVAAVGAIVLNIAYFVIKSLDSEESFLNKQFRIPGFGNKNKKETKM